MRRALWASIRPMDLVSCRADPVTGATLVTAQSNFKYCQYCKNLPLGNTKLREPTSSPWSRLSNRATGSATSSIRSVAESNPRSTCIRRGLYEAEECGQLYSCQSGKPFESGTPPAALEQAGRGCAPRSLQGEDAIVSLAGYCMEQLETAWDRATGRNSTAGRCSHPGCHHSRIRDRSGASSCQ